MFFIKKTKKEEYRTNPLCKPVVINGETAIKPYLYLRNGYIHVRYTVDRCMKLSPSEVRELKEKITRDPSCKQDTLVASWKFYSDCVGKEVIMDGIKELEKNIKGFAENGHKD